MDMVLGLCLVDWQFMWPFALLALACIPMMGFATSLEMKNFLGEDVGDDNAKDETTSPGGIIIETLLNMTTVSALTMEEERYKNFQNALNATEEHYVRDGALQGKKIIWACLLPQLCDISHPITIIFVHRIPCWPLSICSTVD
jgi:ABC-type bacteriocin/lantibiotic exporter with double-glycine peptidase domain